MGGSSTEFVVRLLSRSGSGDTFGYGIITIRLDILKTLVKGVRWRRKLSDISAG